MIDPDNTATTPEAQIEDHSTFDLMRCQACGGRCCTGSPGLWVDPERFFDLFFEGQRLTVDQLRARVHELDAVMWEASGVPMPAPRSIDTGCAFHGPNGCTFTVKQRPCQCLALIPNKATTDKPEGCECLLPQAFSRDEANWRWQRYWGRSTPLHTK